MSDSNTNLKLYGEKCTKLLNESEIRFAGIVDKDGQLVSGGFKDGISPHEGDETRLQSFLEFVSKASIRKEYDESLGADQLSCSKTRQSSFGKLSISGHADSLIDICRTYSQHRNFGQKSC